jgi:hypothetical protein
MTLRQAQDDKESGNISAILRQAQDDKEIAASPCDFTKPIKIIQAPYNDAQREWLPAITDNI